MLNLIKNKKNKTMRANVRQKIENNTLRLEASYRGGGIEIDLTNYGFKGEKMAAYQNYLGGGMLGSIQCNNTINAYDKPVTSKQQDRLDNISNNLMRYFHEITNHSDDEWESATFEDNQRRPASAY